MVNGWNFYDIVKETFSCFFMLRMYQNDKIFDLFDLLFTQNLKNPITRNKSDNDSM